MERLHRGLESVDQLTSFFRDPCGDDAPVGLFPRSARQVTTLEAIEEPRHVWVSGRGALRHRAERSARRPGVSENPQHVILLRGDAVRFEQGGQLVNELAGDMLEQEVDLTLG